MERPFAHQYETGGMRRLWVRGLDEVHKKLLLQAAACNLALLLRTKHGAGTPRGLVEAEKALFGLILALLGGLKPFPDESTDRSSRRRRCDRFRRAATRNRCSPCRRSKIEGLDTGC